MKTFKWLFLGDLQIPYHDKRAVGLVMKVIKSWKPYAIDFTGDIDDQPEYSNFTEGTTAEFFNQLKKEKKFVDEDGNLESDEDFYRRLNPLPFIKEHAKEAAKFYADVAAAAPQADKHASLGNHDIRVFKYLDKKAPSYAELITPNELWGLDDLGITWRHYDEPPLERFAGIHVHHGTTVSSNGIAVRGDLDNFNINLVRGHDHRGGVVYKTFPLSNTKLVGMGTGHLADIKSDGMSYTVNHAWEQGFGIAHVWEGQAQLEFINIKETEKGLSCVVDGKVFVN